MMLAPMAYGIALSKPVKIARNKLRASGAAYHTGAGAAVGEAIDLGGKVIFQYDRGNWPKPQQALLKAMPWKSSWARVLMAWASDES